MAGGRPSTWRDEYADQARKLCLLGADDETMADFFGVSLRTINSWKKKQPEFLHAIKGGKARADAEVASKLYDRATGFEWDEQQAIKVKEVTYDNGKRLKEKEDVVMVTVHRVVPPDTVAAIFWLKNRQKDHWRDTKDLTNKGDKFQPVPILGGLSVAADVHSDNSDT